MKCLVWNMDYWKSPKKEESWHYIQSLNPDVSLLNECTTHESQKNHIHYITRDKWGCGVFSKFKIKLVGAIKLPGTKIINLKFLNIKYLRIFKISPPWLKKISKYSSEM